MIKEIQCEIKNHLGILTLNRPEAMNALSLPMINVLYEQLRDWQTNTSIHAVVICSSEKKAFCAGGDIRWLYHTGKTDLHLQLQFFENEYRLNTLIHHYPKPYIALMDGITMGGGVGISLHGSHPVALDSFLFAMPETTIGFFPDIGASYLLSRCKGNMGMYLGLTGNRLNAEEAGAIGLVSHYIHSSKLDDVMAALTETNLAEDGFHRVSICLNQFSEHVNKACIHNLESKVDSYFKGNSVNDIVNNLLQSTDEWCQETATHLLKKSPLSLLVTYQQIKKAATLEFDQCIDIDKHLVKHFMNDKDFYEGVRALIVDKDKAPKWDPPHIDFVNQDMVDTYFS